MRNVRFGAIAVYALGALACSSHTSIHVGMPEPRDASPPSALEAGTADASLRDGAVMVDAAHDGGGPAAIDAAVATSKPIVIVMIGDGMGRGQLEAASWFAAGAPSKLFMQGLPHRGELTTGGPSGITDSAAAATVMATGVYTYNSQVGIDRDGRQLETLIELAHARGLATGLVTTASLPHATPASFSAHELSRHNYVAIANDQILRSKPHVMLGGGARYYFAGEPGSVRNDQGLLTALAAGGYEVVRDAAGLFALSVQPSVRVFGAFASDHMTYVRERNSETREPTLKEMSLAALERLDQHPAGFFLMIEGARIDMASHVNNLENTVAETLAFDETIAAVADWASTRDEVTLMVTADHECGGLTVEVPHEQGKLPEVSWRWGLHTNARVDVFAQGPGTEVFNGSLRDQRWVYAVSRARLTGEPFVAPERVAIPDGHLTDLRYQVVSQTLSSGFTPGRSQLDALRIDADRYGLFVGVEGLFAWDENALVVALDVDFGAATGHATLRSALSDQDGVADAILSASNITAPAADGYGADFAIVSMGGADPQLGELRSDGGLRGLSAPSGAVDDLGWQKAALNFGEDVRTREVVAAGVKGEGFEVFVPWVHLYPELAGRIPEGATLALAAWLVNSDGGFTSNQALPPFPAGTDNPGRDEVALPGLVVLELDSDADGYADTDFVPSLRGP